MKKTALIVGGIALLGVAGYFLFFRKKEESLPTGLDEAAVDTAVKSGQVTEAEVAQLEAELADAQVAKAELEQLEKQPSTPQTEDRKRTLRDRMAKVGGRVRENTRLGRIARDLGKKTSSNIAEVKENIQVRRQCRKEADNKFGFPLKPKKIKEKRDYIKACKDAGGEDFAFGFTNEESMFAFNGHNF